MTPGCVSILAAMARNRVIGNNNRLPWYLSEDLKRFKSLTMGHTIVMGRKTYDSIGRVLPGRANVIVTNQLDLEIPGAIVVHTLADALRRCDPASENELFIIGGAKLYEQTIELAQRIYLTEIQQDFDGDAYFPDFNREKWMEISREKHVAEGNADERLEYHFVILERKKYLK